MRTVRNWWIEADIDGRKSRLRAGPQGKDGEFTLRVFQRSKGQSIHVLTVEGVASDPDELMLRIIASDEVHFIKTRR